MSKGEQTRREIVSGALTLASEVGLEQISLGVLASSLKLSKSGLFAHFKSKEALQLDVVQEAIDLFVREVAIPAFTQRRGEPRVKALFENYLVWTRGHAGRGGGCFFMALSHEYDDRPGPIRDLLVQSQKDWQETLARAARLAIEEEHFRSDLDVRLFAFEFVGIGMAFQQANRLLENPRAEKMARAAFEELLTRSRAARTPRASRRS